MFWHIDTSVLQGYGTWLSYGQHCIVHNRISWSSIKYRMSLKSWKTNSVNWIKNMRCRSNIEQIFLIDYFKVPTLEHLLNSTLSFLLLFSIKLALKGLEFRLNKCPAVFALNYVFLRYFLLKGGVVRKISP